MGIERRPLRRLLRDLPRGRRRWIAAGTGLAILAALSAVGLVAASGWLITASGIAGAAAGAVALEIFAPGALIRLFAVTRTVTRYLERLLVHEAVFRIIAGLRRTLFERQAGQSFAKLARLRDGATLARLMGDVGRLEQFHAGLLIPILAAAAASLLLILAVTLLTGPGAGLTLLTAVLASGTVLTLFFRRQSRTEGRQAMKQAVHRNRLADMLAAHRVLYFADPADRMAARLERESNDMESRERRLAARAARRDSANQLFFSLAVIALLALAAAMPTPWAPQSPAWLAMAVLGTVALGGLHAGLAPALRRWGGIVVALRRLYADDATPRVHPRDRPEQPPSPCWRMDSVRLNRGLTDDPVLDGVSLCIRAGEQLTLTGNSGAGKTRLAGLLCGLERPDAGTVELDGWPVGDWPEHLRFATAGLLLQRNTLLQATLRDNLILGGRQADDTRLIHALQATGLADSGVVLDDWIGEESRPLSGGEARRVNLLRTVLAGTPAVILDEPFRGLDRESRERVLDWLKNELTGRTVVVLDHHVYPGFADDRHLHLEGGRLSQPPSPESDVPE